MAPSMLALTGADRQSLAPLRLFCDFKSLRGESGKAAVANLRKLSVIRAEWNSSRVVDVLASPLAKAAYAFLLEHNQRDLQKDQKMDANMIENELVPITVR